MYHFQVDNMGVRFCVLFIILQTIIATSLGGVTLPFSDFMGKVTPVKPKTLSPSTVSSSGDLPISKSSPWDGEDILQALCSPSSVGSVSREFSSPLIVTSSSTLKPMIDTSSNLDIKLPIRFGKDTLSCTIKAKVNQKYNEPVMKNTIPPNVCPLSASYPLPCPLYYKLMYLPRVRTPSEIKPSNYMPTSYIGGANINIPSQSLNLLRPTFISAPSNLSSISGRTLCSLEKSSVYPLLVKAISSYLNPVTTSVFTSNIPIPKIPSTLSIEPALSAQKVQIKNPRQPLQKSSCTSAVAFESKDLKPKSCQNPSFNIRGDESLTPLSSSIPYTDKICNSFPSDASLTVPSPTPFTSKMLTLLLPPKPPALPSVSLTTPLLPQASISKPNFEVNSCNFNPSYSDFNVLKTYRSNVDVKTDYSRNVDTFIDTTNNRNTNDLIRKFQPCIDLVEVPSLKRIDFPEKFLRPLIPEISSCYSPIMPETCVSNMREISPLRMPPTPSILPGTSSAFCPKIPQTHLVPTSYINVTPSYSFSQPSSDIVSSINNIVSNISQNILSSCISYLKSPPNNKLSRPKFPKSNPYANSEVKTKQTMPTLPIRTPLPPVNVRKTEPKLPILSSPISINSLPKVLPEVLPRDEPITLVSSSSESTCPQPTFSLLQPITATVVPLTCFSQCSPQLCPSYLPSPNLPSYPVISSPFLMEPIVIKASSSKKNSKEINKLMELMLITELLNDDESFDWDDLDILLAFLSVN